MSQTLKPTIESEAKIAMDKSIYSILNDIVKNQFTYVLDNIIYHANGHRDPMDIYECMSVYVCNMIYSIFSNSIGHLSYALLKEIGDTRGLDYAEFRVAVHENIQSDTIFRDFMMRINTDQKLKSNDYDLGNFFKDFIEYYMTFAVSHCVDIAEPEETTKKKH